MVADKDGFYEVIIEQDKKTWRVEATAVAGFRLTVLPQSFTADLSLIMITVTAAKIVKKKVVTGYW